MELVEVLLKLILVVFLVFMNGFFVAAEFALVKIRASRLETLVQSGNTRAKYAKKLTDHLDASLSVTQLGITLASLGLGWVGEPAVAALLVPVVGFFGFGEETAHSVALVVGFSLITALHIVLGELAPKSMAIQKAESVALNISIPMIVFHRLMWPAVWLLNHVANWVIIHLGFEVASESEEAHSEEEIRLLMEESHKHGYIDKTELTFVDNVFDLSNLTVREIMIPRTDMICLYLEDSFDENVKKALEEQMTRYPVCIEDKDNIIGFLHIKDLLKSLYTKKKTDIRPLVREATVVPESMPVRNLLKLMQGKRLQLAIVVDEYGGTAGMVTLEDIMEEIVGEIQDEFDEERPIVEKRTDKLYSVDAKMLLDDLNEMFGTNIEEENIDTIGGWLSTQVDTPPRVGQKAAFGDDEFFVEEVDRVRITRVLVKINHSLKNEEINE